jgi:hypothetical protein
LTQAQLEYNLPPLQGERLSQRHFRDVLEVLVATGLVQQEDIHASDTPASLVQPQQLQQQPQPRYCVLSGVTRQTPTTPINVLQEIRETQDEWRTSLQRQAKLKAALLNPSIQPREVLKQLLAEFPEIASDPVYVAALRNLHVDVGLVLDNKSGSSRPKGGAKRSRRKPASGSPPKVANNISSPASTTARATITLPAKASTTSPSAPAASQPQPTSAMTLVVEAKAPASATEGATMTKPTATPGKAGPTPT